MHTDEFPKVQRRRVIRDRSDTRDLITIRSDDMFEIGLSFSSISRSQLQDFAEAIATALHETRSDETHES